MKRVLSLVLVLVMVLGTIMPAFAEEATTTASTAGQELFGFGLIAGDGTDLAEDQPLTRAEMAVILAKMNGKAAEAEAYALPTTLTDLVEGKWYVPWVSYAFANEYMTGYNNEFRPMDNLSAQELNTLMVEALGYDVEWATANQQAADLGVAVDAADTKTVLRGEIFAAVRGALDVTPKDGTETLGTTLALEGYEAPVAPTTDLEVVSVTADNNKEIVVVFNNELDDETVIADNFAIVDGADTTVALADDNMTVTVTLDDADAVAVRPLEVTLAIADVMDVNGSEVEAADYDMVIMDATRPVAQSVELTGPRTFDITFSEPIKDAPTVKVNNGIYGSTVNALDGSNVVTVTLAASKLNDGDYTIKVSSFEDYAGISGDAVELTLAYAADTSLPTATIKSATQTQVVVEFDRVVTLEDGSEASYFYHTFTSYNPAAFATEEAKKFTLDFTDHPIPEGDFTLVINYDGANGVEISDAWGNELAENIVLTGSVVADMTAPEFTKIDVKAEDKIILTASEELVGAEDEANYTIKDADGEAVEDFTATYAVDADDVVTVTIVFDAKLAGGVYSIEFADLTDTSINDNEIAQGAMSFEITDLTPITTGDVTSDFVAGVEADDDEIIYIYYPEAMAVEGQYSVLDAANYLINTNGTFVELDDDATLELFGTTGKTVKLTIPADVNLTAGDDLRIARVADTAGNVITTFSFDVNMTAATAPAVTEVLITDTNKATITIDAPLKSVLADGFTTSNGAVAAIDSWTVNDDNETIVKVTVIADDALTTADTAALFSEFNVVGEFVIADTGIEMADADVTALLVDGRAPTVIGTDPLVQTAAKVFTLEFTEDFKAGINTTLAATDLKVTVAGDVLTAGTEYTIGIATDTITITLDASVDAPAVDEDVTVELVASPSYLMDAADNAPEAFDETITIE